MTCSGNWLYCGSYVEPDVDPYAPDGNRMKRRSADRSNEDPRNPIMLWSNWSWTWLAGQQEDHLQHGLRRFEH